MKTLVEQLRTHGILCRKLSELSPKELGTRKKIRLYIGVNPEGYYCGVMVLTKKSRVLRKEAEALADLHQKMEKWKGTTIPRKYIRVNAPLCSRAKAWMEQEGWIFLE